MNDIEELLRLDFLKLKRKLINLSKSSLIQWLSNVDITFIFLFFSLYLFGYNWSWEVLIASFGLWIVIKELFKQIKVVITTKRVIRR